MRINNALTINERIHKWDNDRALLDNGFNVSNEFNMLHEELMELEEAETWDDKVDALCDIIKLAKAGLLKLDCDIDLALDQMMLEIESRKQDPIQAADWEVNGRSGKWQKDLNQCPATLYKADYNKAKV